MVEDEYLIRMLLEDMLSELGYGLAAAVGSIAEASELATDGDFDVAILDVNLDGAEIYPVADILARRGLPFVFVTGYGEASLPENYRGRPPCRSRSRPSSSRPCSPACWRRRRAASRSACTGADCCTALGTSAVNRTIPRAAS